MVLTDMCLPHYFPWTESLKYEDVIKCFPLCLYESGKTCITSELAILFYKLGKLYIFPILHYKNKK